ncbi:hypothetical protein M885DRAFT_560202 [Pelagophyceae sp. CCMP2097]|nr:hypothetical protein M885DRAFT_560202 [Pelagophyceae sp. CCMP2097]
MLARRAAGAPLLRVAFMSPLSRSIWEPGEGAPQDWRSDRHWRRHKEQYEAKESKLAHREGREPKPFDKAAAIAADVPLASAPQFIRKKAQKVLASRERMRVLKDALAEKAALKEAQAGHAVLFDAAVKRKAEEDAALGEAPVETAAARKMTADTTEDDGGVGGR